MAVITNSAVHLLPSTGTAPAPAWGSAAHHGHLLSKLLCASTAPHLELEALLQAVALVDGLEAGGAGAVLGGRLVLKDVGELEGGGLGLQIKEEKGERQEGAGCIGQASMSLNQGGGLGAVFVKEPHWPGWLQWTDASHYTQQKYMPVAHLELGLVGGAQLDPVDVKGAAVCRVRLVELCGVEGACGWVREG